MPAAPQQIRPGQRREKELRNGTLYLRCYGEFHKGEWLPADRFGRQTPTVWHTYCRECRAYDQARRKGGNGTVRVEMIHKWLWEVIHRCDGINAAARTIGVGTPTIYRWLGRYKGHDVKRIQRAKAALILDTLVGLRNGTINPAVAKKKGTRKFVYGCSGCGCNIEDETPGCPTCWDRHSKRRRRAAGLAK